MYTDDTDTLAMFLYRKTRSLKLVFMVTGFGIYPSSEIAHMLTALELKTGPWTGRALVAHAPTLGKSVNTAPCHWEHFF